ncbi:MAG: SDR family oxidoreductase [Balneolaceae bacterium]
MKGKVVLIVGGSGGIGSATAKELAAQGARVILAARNKSKAEKVAKEINERGGDAYAIDVDVTSESSVKSMAQEVESSLGKIDVLVNAFGQGLIQPFKDIEPNDAKEIFDVNVFGTFLVTQTVLKHMNTDKSTNVIMFPGTMGKYVMKNSSVYAASKFAVQGFTKALVEELKRDKVKFTLFYLGGVDTPFWDDERVGMRVKKEMMLNTKDVARSVLSAVMAPGSAVVNEIVMQPESHQLV